MDGILTGATTLGQSGRASDKKFLNDKNWKYIDLPNPLSTSRIIFKTEFNRFEFDVSLFLDRLPGQV